MDVSSLFGALTGNSGVKIEIRLNAAEQYYKQQQNNNPTNNNGIIPMTHVPTWRLHKNPFWRVKQNQLIFDTTQNMHSVANAQQQAQVGNPGNPPELISEQQQQQMLAQQMQVQNIYATTNPQQQQMSGMMQQQQQPNMNNMQQNNSMMYNNNTMMQQPSMLSPQQQPQPQGGFLQQSQQLHAAAAQQQQPPFLQQSQQQYQQQQQQQQPGMMIQQNQQNQQQVPPSFLQAAATQSFELFAYEASQDVGGYVTIVTSPGKKTEHLGIKIQFIGRIDLGSGVHEGRPHYDFVSLSKQLSPPGTIYQSQIDYPFCFKNMEKQYESYKGRNVNIRYFIKVIMERKFFPPITKEHDIWVQFLGSEPMNNEPIKMEVGIEDCLHIEFEYERRGFHLKDTILGKIHFMLVQIKIKHMELAVIRRETSGDGVAASDNKSGGGSAGSRQPNQQQQVVSTSTSTGSPDAILDVNNIVTETQTLIKYEIMDGAPVKGEVIPVKLCLKGLPSDLTPTYPAINNILSVRYFLNLVLVDEEDRRYFKQQEIILWRKELG